jgi:flagellar hook assembly protein FlgD
MLIDLHNLDLDVGKSDKKLIPLQFELNQNYPNPFNHQTTFSYQLPIKAKLTLKIYNMLGEEIRTLVNGNNSAGKYSVIWDGTDNSGSLIGSGIYLYQLRLDNNYLKTKKLLLLK